jgi:3'-phosphoadenosine 5'-phosphosulfate sulfotransferase (PAPS reductase)/FAD synthetase
MLHLVLQQAPGIMVLNWDYGPYYSPRELRREIALNARRIGARNLRIETSPEYTRLGRRAVNVLGREYIGKVMPALRREGYDLAFVGLRREESLKRRRRMDAGRWLSTGIMECWPLAEWTWMDVWAYIISRGLPYLSFYDRVAPVVGYERARFTTLFDPEFAHLGADTVDGVVNWQWRHEGEKYGHQMHGFRADADAHRGEDPGAAHSPRAGAGGVVGPGRSVQSHGRAPRAQRALPQGGDYPCACTSHGRKCTGSTR